MNDQLKGSDINVSDLIKNVESLSGKLEIHEANKSAIFWKLFAPICITFVLWIFYAGKTFQRLDDIQQSFDGFKGQIEEFKKEVKIDVKNVNTNINELQFKTTKMETELKYIRRDLDGLKNSSGTEN